MVCHESHRHIVLGNTKNLSSVVVAVDDDDVVVVVVYYVDVSAVVVVVYDAFALDLGTDACLLLL